MQMGYIDQDAIADFDKPKGGTRTTQQAEALISWMQRGGNPTLAAESMAEALGR